VSHCPACGHANADGAKFCSECGGALVGAQTAAHEERKVVTVLFADLVGFTKRSEQLDPEDVRAVLSPYYVRLRTELERFGGTVEKFIGDAVMALFGAPVTHEDDPERAVRAALAIRDWVRAEEAIEVRIAVNTGEALVTLGARPTEGEGMAAGDVINTTARLQAAAPVNGVLVGERTYRATRRVIDYVPVEAVAAKGKENPVSAWEAVGPRSSFGVDVPDTARTTLVGRERELGALRDGLDRTLAERSPQLLTLIGVPGIGKSRLLHELSLLVDGHSEFISWRQGRSLPYGEGVSFWALAEIFKAQAGVLDSDESDVTEEKLTDTVREVLPDEADAEWVRRHMRELVGLRRDRSSTGDVRDEAFAAWRRFLEALAEHRPLVLVFEDLHWADDGLLDFIDHLADWVTDVPLLVVCSARPELLSRRPGWGGGKPNATTLSLAPLSDDDTARLIGELCGRPLLQAEQQRELLLRAAGNPLFAEQYVQMLSEHEVGESLPVPETVQDLVGARLDSLPLASKRLLQDAAVIGKVFWPSAVAALVADGDDRSDLGLAFHELARRQFIRRERRSSLAGEEQYAFLHVVLRDVAYGQIPRGARIDRHVRAATWLESLDRPDELAEMLAHHYVSALELMQATGQDSGALGERARVALRAAGDRAFALNAYPTALAHYEAALALWPDTPTTERAQLLLRAARADQGFDYAVAPGRLEEARDALLVLGLRADAAEAEARIAGLWWFRGRGDRCAEHARRAETLVRDEPDTPAKAYVLYETSRFRMLAGESDLAPATEGLRLAESLGIVDLRAHFLITIGTVRARDLHEDAADQIRQGLDIALAGNFVNAAIRGYSNLAAMLDGLGVDQAASYSLSHEALDYARRLGAPGNVRWARGTYVQGMYEIGNWIECRRECDAFLDESSRIGAHYLDSQLLRIRATLRLGCGDTVGALADQAASLVRARDVQDPQTLLPVLVTSADLLAVTGDHAAAQAAFDEFLGHGPSAFDFLGGDTIDLVNAADLLGRRDALSERLAAASPTPWRHIAQALLVDDFDTALPMLLERNAHRLVALTRLRAARAGAATGTPADWQRHLHEALAFLRAQGALGLVREGEALLAASA
jgi:class 3 adenylate cyclase/tetratricopeptide (TPR) repeat protein